MKDTAIAILGGLIMIYSMISAIALGIGLSDTRDCKERPARIQYVFPAYRLGCWLAVRPPATVEDINNIYE